MMKYLCKFLLALSLTGSAAQAGQGYMGVGNASCGAWLETRKDQTSPKSYQLRAWLLGFISGANNAISGEMLDGIDGDAIFASIDKRCLEDPLQPMAEAANYVTIELLKKAIAAGKVKL